MYMYCICYILYHCVVTIMSHVINEINVKPSKYIQSRIHLLVWEFWIPGVVVHGVAKVGAHPPFFGIREARKISFSKAVLRIPRFFCCWFFSQFFFMFHLQRTVFFRCKDSQIVIWIRIWCLPSTHWHMVWHLKGHLEVKCRFPMEKILQVVTLLMSRFTQSWELKALV